MIQGTFKLFASKDASIDISINWDFRRLIVGGAYTDAAFNRDVKMRMFVFHLLFVSLCLTSFSAVERAEEPAPKPARGSSPTRRYNGGKGRRKGR